MEGAEGFVFGAKGKRGKRLGYGAATLAITRVTDGIRR